MTNHIAPGFDWDDVAYLGVIEILGLNGMTRSDGSARWDAIAIRTESKSVLVAVEPDTDQVIITIEDKPEPFGDGWKSIPSLAYSTGRPLGWCWVGTNSQGYEDSFTVAFGGAAGDALTPRCMFLAEASSLCCFDLAPHTP